MEKLFLSFIVVGCCLVSACSPKSEQERLNEVQNALQTGKLKEAELIVKEGIRQTPSLSLRLMLADIYIKRGEVLGALKEVDRLKLDQLSASERKTAESINAHIALLNFDTQYTPLEEDYSNCDICLLTSSWSHLVDSGELKAIPERLSSSSASTAINAFKSNTANSLNIPKLIKDVTFDHELLIIADLMRRGNNIDGLITAYSEYAERYPNTVNIYLPYAQALIIKGRYEEADVLISNTLDRFEKSPVANYLKSLVLISQSKNEQALNYASLADTYGMNSSTASLTKGMLEFNFGNYESALNSFQKAISINPQSEIANTMFTATQVKLGITSDALSRLAELDSFSETQLVSIGQLIGKNKDANEWNSIKQKLLEKDSATSNVLSGLIDLAKGEQSSALRKGDIEEDEVYNLIQVAMLLNSNQLTDAITYVEKWLEVTNEKGKVLNYKGAIEVASGNRDAARKTFQQALELNPSNRASYMFFAQSSAIIGNYEEALNSISKILDNNAKDIFALKLFVAYERLVKTKERQNQFIRYVDTAIDTADDSTLFRLLKSGYFLSNNETALAAQEITKVDPELAENINQFWEIRFAIATQSADLLKAEQVTEDWKRAFPQKARPFHAIAFFYEEINAVKKAIKALEQLPREQVTDLQAASIDAKLISLYIKIRDFVKAEYLLSRLSENEYIQPATIFYLKGFLEAGNNNLSKSISMLEKSYELNKSPQALKLLFIVNTRMGNRSLELLEQHLDKFPEDTSIKLLLAEQIIPIDRKKAISLYEDIIKTVTTNADVFNNYAWLLYLEDDYTSALKNVEQALLLKPDNNEYIDTLFRILTAQTSYQKIVDLGAKVSTHKTRLLLANAYLKLGNSSEAKRLLDQIEQKYLDENDSILYDKII
jgi:tetratricopeptide (TPR) repeat protein